MRILSSLLNEARVGYGFSFFRTLRTDRIRRTLAGWFCGVNAETLPHSKDFAAPTVLRHHLASPRAAPSTRRKTLRIVVYCANVNCQNSHIAAGALAKLGYRHVAAYAEGKQDWIEAGLPVQSGPVLRRAA